MRASLRPLTLIAATAVLIGVSAVTTSAQPSGGSVLPATARPLGWSLTRMDAASASYNVGGAILPDAPFEFLHVGSSHVKLVNGGLKTFGSNSFTVPQGTLYYLPIFSLDDSPPVLGAFPTSHQQAITYFFDPSQVGARHITISVDGTVTPVGSAYLAGPLTTQPLPDGGGTHIITLAAFLGPLTPGTHMITIRGGVFGSLIFQTYGLEFITEADTYTVNVQ